MKITEHRKKKTGQVYWLVRCETDEETRYCINCGFKTAKFPKDGMSFLIYETEEKDSLFVKFGAAATEATEEENDNNEEGGEEMAAEALNVNDLRIKAREINKGKALGIASTDIQKWSKDELVNFVDSDGTIIPEPDVSGQLADLLKKLAQSGCNEERVKQIVDDCVKENMGIASRRFTFVLPEKGTEKEMGVQHRDFEKILTLAKLTQGENKKNLPMGLGLDGVCLWGGAGGGKTFLAHATAEALEVDFYFCGCHPHMTATTLFGYCTATGDYVPSAFYKAFKFGGVFLLDEGDRAPEGIVTSLNGATSNGFYTFPNGEQVSKHQTFCLLLGSNTNLRGNDVMYNSAKKQDGSVLDRYTFFELKYDEEFEKMLSGGNLDWYRAVKKYRDALAASGIRHLITPRATKTGATLLLTGMFSWQEVEEMTIWKGLDPDQVRKVKEAA